MTRSHPHKSPLIAAGLLAVALSGLVGLFPSAAASAEGSRLTDVRIGRHPTFRRIVLVFDRAPDIARLGRDDSTLELEIQAEAPQERTYFGTADSPIGVVELIRSRWSTSDGQARSGLRFRAALDRRRARVFALTEPPRLVVDIAPPGEAAFESPAGTISIFERPSPGPESESEPPLPIPELSPAPPVVEVEQPSVRPAPPVSRVPSLTIQREPTPIEEIPGPREERLPQTGDDEVLPDRPVIQQGRESESQSTLDPRLLREPEQSAAPDLSPVEPPTPSVAEAPSQSAPAATPRGGAIPWSLPWLLGAIVAGTALWLIFSRSFRSSIDADSGMSSALELETASRLEALEKRMDEEARARVAMEERLLHLHEELKVMRDRLTRRARRPD